MDKRFIVWDEFQEAMRRWPKYYTQERWQYFKVAREWASAYPGTVLEAGPFHFPLVKDGYYLDIKDHCGKTSLIHDLNEPIPLPDGTFQAGVALQIIEHLWNPHAAIRELVRVAQHVVVSIPWGWPSGEPGHAGLGESDFEQWTAGLAVTRRQVLGTFPHKRLIFEAMA